MAAMTINPLCSSITAHTAISRINSRMSIITTVCCQNQDPDKPFNPKEKKKGSGQDKGKGKGKRGLPVMLQQVVDYLSPKQKGDWKDITLMSLSFAVYIYMSQKIVCAYCVWMSMSRQPW